MTPQSILGVIYVPMNSKEDIKPISYVKSHTADILKQVNTTHRPIYITQNGEAKGVLMDTESYENMQKTLGLLKVLAQGENDIANNKVRKNLDVFTKLENKFFANVKK